MIGIFTNFCEYSWDPVRQYIKRGANQALAVFQHEYCYICYG